jgi:asparagine synthase (glutamine-hydrolysing)
MPGIVGCITRLPREDAEAEVRRMTGALLHESFYVAGAWAEESQGVYVGWVSRRGSFSEEMPLRNEHGDVVLAFSGEEFPEPGTAQRLKARGHVLDVDGPSYLVHLYEDDPSFPAGLNGRFHGLLWDRKRGTSVLFNDRYGMHRIYYHFSKDAFYFAAEAKAILAVRPELRRMDSRGLGEFVSCGAVLENRTLFEDIHVLPPASAWVFRNGLLQKKDSYFHPKEWVEQETLDPEVYYRELRQTFTRNLPRYFPTRERIGMSLTGGLDSRMILACREPDPGSLPCYTFGSMFRENQDVRVARRVADICRQSHETITAGDEFLSQFARYAERAVYLTDGCVDVGRAPDLYLNQRAREIAPVRMTGTYGGEVLRGIRAFKPVEPVAGLFSPEVLSKVHLAAETYAEVLHGHPVSFAAFRQGPSYLYGVLALEQTQLSVRSPYLDNDFVRTVFRSPASALASNEISMRLVADGSRALFRIPTDRGLTGNRRSILGATSRGLLEFLFKAEYASDMGMPQWLARFDHALSPLRFEHLFLGRHKPFHFRVWYRDALARYVREMLLDPRALSRPYIERTGLEAVVRGHLQGNRNYTTELHKVLTLELFHRLFLDNPERGGSAARLGAAIAVGAGH